MTLATVADRYTETEIAHFYATGQWHTETLFDVLRRRAADQPERIFVTDDCTALTFKDVHDRALGLAHELRRRGISRGDRVSVQLPNWSEYVIVTSALARLGAIQVPILPIYRREEVGYMLKNAGVRLAIAPSTFKKFDYLDMYRTLQNELPDLEAIVVVRAPEDSDGIRFESLAAAVDSSTKVDDEIGDGVGPDEPFVVVYSSGTTSRPKGCVHTFNTLGCGARMMAKGLAYTSDDVQFGISPITHTTGLVTNLLLPLLLDATTHLMEAWEPKRGIEQARTFGCTIAVSATTFLQTAMDVYDPDVDDLGSMRLWVAAGAPIPGSVVERAADLFPKMRVLSLYGRTENAVATMCTVEDDPQSSVISDGRALALQSIKIVDAAGNEVPRGQEGDIAYKGAEHMLEYLGNPAETAALFTHEGYSLSGDLGHMDADGFVRVTGRTKDIVIRGGLNISVREVEDLLTAHPAVRAVAVVGMPNKKLGEALCCYVVPAPGEENITLETIKDFLLNKGLAIQKVPERLEIVEALPMTATGKIQKHVLRAEIAGKIADKVDR